LEYLVYLFGLSITLPPPSFGSIESLLIPGTWDTQGAPKVLTLLTAYGLLRKLRTFGTPCIKERKCLRTLHSPCTLLLLQLEVD
jgi:hypothetical protein